MEHYTVDNVAKMLSLHPASVRRLVRQGKLNSVRIGNKMYFTIDDILEYVRRNTENK
ncbi:helix-turn-helix domain-containing protein [Dethiobacter alkaliphilus]|uniref:DNA binding domain protein, excisionase family n=1 Tax=Dethiobacter alkaliphilus AHT 1 TaxID=555088 RepID=C0GET9_DETAL|nr:DNA binding domain protein, excisionase family [Dethiobacter alkaliphilus AHT 1]